MKMWKNKNNGKKVRTKIKRHLMVLLCLPFNNSFFILNPGKMRNQFFANGSSNWLYTLALIYTFEFARVASGKIVRAK
jgi:hypothetical protein